MKFVRTKIFTIFGVPVVNKKCVKNLKFIVVSLYKDGNNFVYLYCATRPVFNIVSIRFSGFAKMLKLIGVQYVEPLFLFSTLSSY